MLIYTCQEGHSTCLFEGTVSDLVADIGLCVVRVYNDLHKKNPNVADIFKELLVNLVNEDGEGTLFKVVPRNETEKETKGENEDVCECEVLERRNTRVRRKRLHI